MARKGKKGAHVISNAEACGNNSPRFAHRQTYDIIIPRRPSSSISGAHLQNHHLHGEYTRRTSPLLTSIDVERAAYLLGSAQSSPPPTDALATLSTWRAPGPGPWLRPDPSPPSRVPPSCVPPPSAC